MFVVWCHMHEDSGMKHKGNGNNMNMADRNNATDETHGGHRMNVWMWK